MIEYPKITVVTPNFNQGEYLEKTILSVINQNYPNLEYIVIDGGSTDNSIEIIKKYERYFTYWISENDNGLYHGLNKGFKISTGEFLTWINSDDILQPYALHTISDIFKRFDDIYWINGIPNNIDEYDRIIWAGDLPRWTKYHFHLGHYKYIQQEGSFWRKSLWESVGAYINTEYKYASDLELWSRFFQKAEPVYLPVLLGSFRLRKANQKTLENIKEYNNEAERIIKKLIIENSYDEEIIKKGKSYIWKILKKLNYNNLTYFMGYRDIHDIFFEKKPRFKFNRKLQQFDLIK